MPGVIGFVGRPGGEPAAVRLLPDMARALEAEPLFHTDLYQEKESGLGRVSLRVVNPEPQPVWNAAKNLCLFMEGEIYDYQAQKKELVNRGYQFQIDNDAEFILHLFEEYGDDFALKLNGSFVAAIWDRQARRLVVANDRLGTHPLYYARHGGRLLFASGVRAILADPGLSREVDRLTLAQFLTFDHAVGQGTLLSSVRLLPQGSLLVWQDGEMAIRPYWEPRHPLLYELRPEEEWMDELIALLRQAVTRQAAHDTLPSGMMLSGGLDSRALLVLLREGPPPGPFLTFTWGIPRCDDARYAEEVAARLKTEHHFFELRPDWLLSFANDCVRATDGLGNLINLHARATLDEETADVQILYKGFLGDAMFGFAQRHQHWADYNLDDATQAHLQVHREQGVITFEPAVHSELFTGSFLQAIGDGVMASYRQGMAESGSTQLADQRIYYDYRQRVPRHTLNGVLVVRSRAVPRLPFGDNDLVEFALRIPPGLRLGRQVMRNAFIRAYPDLAKIPVPDTGLPMMDCARDVRLRAERLARWHLNRLGLKWVAYPGRRPYKDYNTWFRTVLRTWTEETLLGKRALERGYFNPDFVRRLVAEHTAGTNHSIRLGALLAVELWHRQFLDC